MAGAKRTIKPAVAAYLAFIMFGSLISIINSNFIILSNHFSQSLSVISYMISAMAVGRLATIFIAGIVSDKIGRKAIMALSVICVCVFYGGLPLTKSIGVGMALAVLAGMGHGMVDSAATALLFDCFPQKPDFAIGLIQAFFCLGAFSTPIVTSYLYNHNLYFGWLFWGLCGLGVLTVCWILLVAFPSHIPDKTEVEQALDRFHKKPSAAKEGVNIALISLLYSIATTTMTTWIGTYAIEATGLTELKSIQILSYYNIGCMLGTVLMARWIAKIHPTVFLIANPIGMSLILLVYVFLNNPAVTFAVFIAVGFFAGINYSLMLSVAGELFPKKKATISGATMGMSALGAIITPLFTSFLYDSYGITWAFYFLFIAFGLLIVAVVLFRGRYQYLKKAPSL